MIYVIYYEYYDFFASFAVSLHTLRFIILTQRFGNFV